jgi:nitroimidazol reductase NimA-like FMN-containing flavoprotein (pyridoxamine 5'-phosphate oxidase superfamily)
MAEARNKSERLADTRRRLDNDADAWLASTSGDKPWLVPLSFLWHEGELVFATDASTPTGENVGLIPRVRVALGHTRDVVIVEGEATLAPSTDLTAAEVRLYQLKHSSDPRAWADSIVRVRPLRIQAWREENELAGRLLMRDGNWLQ